VDSLRDTELAKAVFDAGRTDYSYWEFAANTVPQANNILKKYINIIGLESIVDTYPKYIGGSTSSYWWQSMLPDGTLFSFGFHFLESSGVAGYVTMDVTGTKGPNIWGRDTFNFYMDDKGNVFPKGSMRAKELGDSYWKDSINYCGAEGSSISEIPSWATGEGCAARIIENGWVMDY